MLGSRLLCAYTGGDRTMPSRLLPAKIRAPTDTPCRVYWWNLTGPAQLRRREPLVSDSTVDIVFKCTQVTGGHSKRQDWQQSTGEMDGRDPPRN